MRIVGTKSTEMERGGVGQSTVQTAKQQPREYGPFAYPVVDYEDFCNTFLPGNAWGGSTSVLYKDTYRTRYLIYMRVECSPCEVKWVRDITGRPPLKRSKCWACGRMSTEFVLPPEGL